jgi:MFS family permease
VTFLVVGNVFVPMFASSTAGIPASAIGLGLAVRPGIILAISATFGAASQRLALTPLLVGLAAVGAVGIALVPLAADAPVVLYVALALQGFGVSYSAAAANVLVARHFGRERLAVAVAATNLGSRVAMLGVTPALGLIYQRGSPTAAFVAGSVLVGLIAAALARQSRPARLQEVEAA